MSNINIKNWRYIWVLYALLIIGFFAGTFLVYERHQIEKVENHIENIVDYDAILRNIVYEKEQEETLFAQMKAAGVTAMAIYDRTLGKMADRGEIRILRAEDLYETEFYGSRSAEAGVTYIFPVENKYNYFQEAWESLNHRLGEQKVPIVQTSRGIALALRLPYESLLDMNLGISALQAKEVVARDFNVIVRPTNFTNITKADVDFTFARLEGIPRITGLVFVGKDVLGSPSHLETTLHWLDRLKIPLVGIESVNQLQYERQNGFMELAKSREYSVGRLYTIAKDELKKLEPSEVAQRFYISDMERNIRYNLFPVAEKGAFNKTALQTTITYIGDATEKLSAKGYEFGRASIYPAYYPRVGFLLLTMLGTLAMIVLVLNLYFEYSNERVLIIFICLAALLVGLYLMRSEVLVRQILALGAAVMAPVGAIVMLMRLWKKHTPTNPDHVGLAVTRSILYLCIAAAMSAVGGIFVASLLSSTDFFMEFELFRGVKLTFILPIILTALAYLKEFPLWEGKTIETSADARSFVVSFLQKDVKIYVLLLFALIGVIGWIFIGRSGHTAGVPVPSWEIALRRFLENNLYVRPREKEFLIGHPALVMASFMFFRRWPIYLHFAFTLAGVIGIASMVETFAHIRTPVYLSLMRGFDGLLLGILFGILALLLLRFLEYTVQWYKKREGCHE